MLISQKLLEALNEQVVLEAESSQAYLAAAAWLETQKGLDGITEFFYQQSAEERDHMLRLISYISDREAKAVITALRQPKNDFRNLVEVFEDFKKNELNVSDAIHNLVDLALSEKDYLTFEFLQWYLREQLEEEKLAIAILDRLEFIGESKIGIYELNRDILALRTKISKDKKAD